VEWLEHLPSKCEALRSNPSDERKKERKKERERKENIKKERARDGDPNSPFNAMSLMTPHNDFLPLGPTSQRFYCLAIAPQADEHMVFGGAFKI
jgi:hypothetical protein